MKGYPKVLVGMITCSFHDYVQEASLYGILHFSYPNFNVLIVDTDENLNNFVHLTNKYAGHEKITILKCETNKDQPANTRTALGREMIRQFGIQNNYDHILFMDADWILPPETIDKLMSHDKDCVGFLYNYGIEPFSQPSIAKSGAMKMNVPARTGLDRLDTYTWKEVYENLYPRTVRCYGCGIGLVKRKVFEAVPWRFVPGNFIGDDVQFWNECFDKGFEWWCDTSIKVIHMNKSWTKEMAKGVANERN